MRLCPIILHLIAATAFGVAALAQEKKPPLQPGRDPGGVAIALVTTGIDYTVPEVAQRSPAESMFSIGRFTRIRS